MIDPVPEIMALPNYSNLSLWSC